MHALRRPLTVAAIVGCMLAAVPSTDGAGTKAPMILGYPYGRQCPAAGYQVRVDRWNMNTCNCTSYVAWALDASGRWVGWFQAGEMDALDWPRVASLAGIPEGRAPRIGAVAVWPRLSPPYGHLAFVTAVHRDGTFDVAEYNLRRRFRFDARYRVSTGGATFIYVPFRASSRG